MQGAISGSPHLCVLYVCIIMVPPPGSRSHNNQNYSFLQMFVRIVIYVRGSCYCCEGGGGCVTMRTSALWHFVWTQHTTLHPLGGFLTTIMWMFGGCILFPRTTDSDTLRRILLFAPATGYSPAVQRCYLVHATTRTLSCKLARSPDTLNTLNTLYTVDTLNTFIVTLFTLVTSDSDAESSVSSQAHC